MKTTIACGQFVPAPANMGHNAELMSGQAREAVSRGARLIVFPELCLSGYLPADEMRGVAVAVDSPEIRGLQETARRVSISICFGFAERTSSGLLHNSAGFVDASGALLAVYRKVHLWDAEGEWPRQVGSSGHSMAAISAAGC